RGPDHFLTGCWPRLCTLGVLFPDLSGLSAGQHYTDDFAQVNPLRKVPALKDGDFVLAESPALRIKDSAKVPKREWLCQALQIPHLPQIPGVRASLGRAKPFSLLVHQMMFPMYLGQPVPPEMLASTMAELDRCLQMLEDKFLRDQAFLTGPHISVADLMAITELMHPVSAGCKIFESRPKLAAWHQRVEAAVGENLFQEAHAVILKAKDMPPLKDPTLKEKLKLSVQYLFR
uniref:glutathione transferase n=1 Tax=Peromyscus maniculatus bairdii TaxID=230844 RepID=A0A8C8UFZ8_PERMB